MHTQHIHICSSYACIHVKPHAQRVRCCDHTGIIGCCVEGSEGLIRQLMRVRSVETFRQSDPSLWTSDFALYGDCATPS